MHMQRNLLKLWKSNVTEKFTPNTFNKNDIDRVVEILESIFSENYFQRKVNNNNQTNLSITDNEDLLNFLLCQFNTGSITQVIEIAQVLNFFNNKEHKDYLHKQLFAKGKVKANFYEGIYFEMYMIFVFMWNGIPTQFDTNDPTISTEKPIDCLIKLNNDQYLVECKFLPSKKKHTKALDLTYFILEEFYRRREKIIETSKISINRLNACGYYILNDNTSNAKINFANNLKRYFHNQINGQIANSELNFEPISDCFIEEYKEGLFENYPIEHAELAIKFKFVGQTNDVSFTVRNSADEIVEKIKSSIKEKKSQHQKSNIENKIIVIGILNGHASIPPVNKDFFISNRKRFKDKLSNNMTAMFIIKNTLGNGIFDIVSHSISKNNPKLEEKLNNLQLYMATKRKNL